MTEPEQRPTVKVRIAVAVDERGRYVVEGWSNGQPVTDEGLLACVREKVDAVRRYGGPADPVSFVFVEANVPLAHTETVEGKVVNGD